MNRQSNKLTGPFQSKKRKRNPRKKYTNKMQYAPFVAEIQRRENLFHMTQQLVSHETSLLPQFSARRENDKLLQKIRKKRQSIKSVKKVSPVITKKVVPLLFKTEEEPKPKKLKVKVEQKVEQKLTLKQKPKQITLWMEKYRPKNRVFLKGNQWVLTKLEKWIQDYPQRLSAQKKLHQNSKYRMKYAALLFGPAGVGKTSTAELILKDAGYRINHVNASDIRTGTKLYDIAKNTVCRKMFGKTALILDEMDGATMEHCSSEDIKLNSGIQGICKFLSDCTSRVLIPCAPLIIICNAHYTKEFRPLRLLCDEFKFNRLKLSDLCSIVQNIAFQENLSLEESTIKMIARDAQGDARQVSNIMQTMFGSEVTKKQKHCQPKFIEPSRKVETDYTDSSYDVFKITQQLYTIKPLTTKNREILHRKFVHHFQAHDRKLQRLIVWNASSCGDISPWEEYYENVSISDIILNVKNMTSLQLSKEISNDILYLATRTSFSGSTVKLENEGYSYNDFTVFQETRETAHKLSSSEMIREYRGISSRSSRMDYLHSGLMKFDYKKIN